MGTFTTKKTENQMTYLVANSPFGECISGLHQKPFTNTNYFLLYTMDLSDRPFLNLRQCRIYFVVGHNLLCSVSTTSVQIDNCVRNLGQLPQYVN